MRLKVQPSKLQGSIKLPSSKSQTMRAILFASMATGESKIYDYLPSPDTDAMITACQALGAQIQKKQEYLCIHGVAGQPKASNTTINSGNSGLVLRFIGGISALIADETVITGDTSICSNRPIQPLLEGLTQLNAMAVSMQNNGYAPIRIKGPLFSGTATIDGEDSQPVSGLLIAAAFSKATIELHVKNPGEKPWIDLTLDWFDRFGIAYERQGYHYYKVFGNANVKGFEYTVPGDLSACAFPLVAALITQSALIIQNVDLSDPQGDKRVIDILKSMGASIAFDEYTNTLTVERNCKLKGTIIDVNDCIDALPILTVAANFSHGETKITNASIARQKECDRLSAITSEINKMKGNIQESRDSLTILPSPLIGNIVQSFQDHRIAMSLIVAGLASTKATIVENIECISKSFPDFIQKMKTLGADLEIMT